MNKAPTTILLALGVLFISFSVKAQQHSDSTCSDSSSLKGSLIVYMENAVKEGIVGATALVMDGEKQVAGGIMDFSGFLRLDEMEPGKYQVAVRSVNTSRQRFDVTIAPDSTSVMVFRTNAITELDAIVVSERDPRKGCQNEPFFDPYGQPKAKRGWLYCEMPSVLEK